MPCNVRPACIPRRQTRQNGASPRRPPRRGPSRALIADAILPNAIPNNVSPACAPSRQTRRTGSAPRRPPRRGPSRALTADANLPNAMPYNVSPAYAPSRQTRRTGTAPRRPPNLGPSRALIADANLPKAMPYNVARQRPPAGSGRTADPASDKVPMQRGTAARPVALRASPPRHPTEATRARRPSTHSQCAGQPPHPPPIADDTGSRSLYLTHPCASPPSRRPDH
jgi:hypothetical protein